MVPVSGNPTHQAPVPSSAAITTDTGPEATPTSSGNTGNPFAQNQLIEVASRDALSLRHVKNIGQGGTAVIEMVAHKETNHLFALKTFRRYHGRRFEKARRAFNNEVSIMKRLSSHTHIIQIWGSYISGREQGILLSPVASDGDLAAYLARAVDSSPTNEQKAVLNRAFGCLASGLAHIHQHTIRHKDIKPQNILIHEGRVIYTDFGISFDADQQSTTTVGYPGVYTRRYCAPEVKDWENRNRKSDVYSLGCVFVEILDVLEPEVGFRHMDDLPYFEKLDEIRRILVHASVATRMRKELLRICHDMMNPNQDERIDTSSVLGQITGLGSSRDSFEIGLFCDDCILRTESRDMAAEEELVEDFTVLSLNANQTAGIISSELDIETTEHEIVDFAVLSPDPNLTAAIAPFEAETENAAPKGAKKSKKKRRATSINSVEEREPIISRSTFRSGTTRYHCTACGELGHNSSKCPNKCWACGELYHKSADCPKKCWTCDEVGHYARDCPNECDACDEVGHTTDECPNKCWTCGEVGHFARDCQDECFVCGRLGHGTEKCKGKCHKCGKIGHWKRDCDDACFECGELGHWAAQCPNKRKKGKRKGACYECGDSGHWAAECPQKQRKWRPIFEQVPQGPFRVKARRGN